MLPYVYICYHVHYYICYFEETNPLIRAKMNMKIDLKNGISIMYFMSRDVHTICKPCNNSVLASKCKVAS